MRETLSTLLCYLSVFGLFFTSLATNAKAIDPSETAQTKDWTFLVFLNGNNNLDPFGTLNLKQMEKVGSTADINIVVQWASLANKKVERLYIKKSTNPQSVTSPVVQDLGKVDMGDWKSLVDFVRWGVQNYPAKHYFIDIWDHGSGWHAIKDLEKKNPTRNLHAFDISWDDNTGHSITTVQLGQALSEASNIMGHKVDLYASDACLMAMAEIAAEVANSVQIFAGSEEVEPGQGWPYDTFLKRWVTKPTSTATEVGKMLTDEYIAAYTGGEYGNQDATFSAFDLSKMDVMNQAITHFGKSVRGLESSAKSKVVHAALISQNFTYSDYVDLSDFLDKIDGSQISGLGKTTTSEVKEAIDQFVVAHGATDNYARAMGVSFWLPTEGRAYNSYSNLYGSLKFQRDTNWSQALQHLLNH